MVAPRCSAPTQLGMRVLTSRICAVPSRDASRGGNTKRPRARDMSHHFVVLFTRHLGEASRARQTLGRCYVLVPYVVRVGGSERQPWLWHCGASRSVSAGTLPADEIRHNVGRRDLFSKPVLQRV